MAEITQIISSQQGTYEWRVRDCLITAAAVIKAQGLQPPDYSSWHALEEIEAMRLAQEVHNSLFEAHCFTFDLVGLVVQDLVRKPGDICLLEGHLSNRRLGMSMDVKNITRLGFVVDNYEIWTWFQSGLFPLHDYSIRGIVRCRP